MYYLYMHSDYPYFTWDAEAINTLISDVRNAQGKLLGKMTNIGFDLQIEASLQALTLEVLKSNEIEGESMNTDQVRSSIARKLGLEIPGLVHSDRNVDGVVDMMMDATQNHTTQLTEDRLFAWHNSLFPSGRSGLYTIKNGHWRDDSTGPMQIVSGAIGKEKVHYQAPDALNVPFQMHQFIHWVNDETVNMDTVLKAAIAHLWFVTIHPFEDGNGRIARAITEMLLCRSDNSAQRFYSMSAQIRAERKSYYDILERTQRGGIDITHWLVWFLVTLNNAIESSDEILSNILKKANFWKNHSNTIFNERQKLMINKLLDGFEGKLQSSKWAKITKSSPDTALRDIKDLIDKGVLTKDDSGGRSTHYELV